jgi:hypothetical protein
LRQEQKETVGLAKGGQPNQSTGVSNTPVKPTLASQGIDKNLANQGRKLGALSDKEFEEVIGDAREHAQCPLIEVDRKWSAAGQTAAFDPQET